MKLQLSLKSLVLTGSLALLLATPALSEEAQVLEKQGQPTPTGKRKSFNKTRRSDTSVQPSKSIKKIRKLSEVELLLKNVQKLVQAPTPSPTVTSEVIEVTGVRLNSTAQELEVILQTTAAEKLQIVNQSQGNNFIADIPNAQLKLPTQAEGASTSNEFRQDNPGGGITLVTVANLDANTIRLTVTGETTQPKVELFDSNEGLIFGVASTASITQTPPTQPTPQTQQPASETPSDEPTADSQDPIELVVTGEQDGYSIPNATTATRTDTPLRDIPQSIQVIPQQVLEDQQVIRLTDALRNVSGVVQGGNFGGTDDQLNIRGFDAATTLRDGFKDNAGGFRETANVEQIEVLKGPASILYGNVQPGGIINLVSKKPLSEPYSAFDFSVGSFSYYRPTIDLSGPLNLDKTLLYRLNIAYENADSFRDFVNGERFFIGPVFEWKISNQTDLLINTSYLYDNRTFDRGLVAFGRGIADIPISRFLGEPGDERQVERFDVGYRLEHRFNENLTLRNAFQFASEDNFDYRAEPLTLDEATGELSRNFRSNDDYNEIYSLQTDVVGKFETGSVKHTLLFGVDLSRQTSEGSQRRLPGGLTPSINIFDPVYNLIPRPSISELTNIVRDGNSTTDQLGLFIQDQIAFSDNIKLLLGGRFDTVEQNSFDRTVDNRSSQNDEAFTPRIGIVYQPIQPISLYASYSRSFAPNSGQSVDRSFLEPERGTQYEVGIKADLNNRLSATLAAYEITKTNIATIDPGNNDFALPIGEQRSRGIELDIAGEIIPGWNIFASYGYTNAEITQGSIDFPVGAAVALVPEHKASLWTTYEILQGNLQGLGFGLGLFYVAERPADLNNSYVLPSYFRTDAAIFYKRDNWKAAINIKNLFDTEYFESINFGRTTVVPGAPLTVVGSFSINF